MLEILTGSLLTFKTFLVSSTVGLFGGIKAYTGALYLLTKPFVIYGTMRFTWIMGLATVEWWSGRLYSINCIGEGIDGFYNHNLPFFLQKFSNYQAFQENHAKQLKFYFQFQLFYCLIALFIFCKYMFITFSSPKYKDSQMIA